MRARLLYLAAVLSIVNLVSLALISLTAAQAASGSGMVFASPAKRALFRPWHEIQGAGPNSADRLVPHNTASRRDVASPRRSGAGMAGQRRDQSARVFDSRSGIRKAVPVTRGQELGLRFRPDDRASPYTQPDAWSGTASSPPGSAAALQSQFRPLPARRKPTYEEMQERFGEPASPQVPRLPYPPLSAPATPFVSPMMPPW